MQLLTTASLCGVRKASLGLRQIAALMAPSVSTLRSHRHVANASTSCFVNVEAVEKVPFS